MRHCLKIVEEVVVIDPVDAHLGEAQEIDAEDFGIGQKRAAVPHLLNGGDLELEHHDGDDDGDDAVREGFKARAGEGVCHERWGQHTPAGGYGIPSGKTTRTTPRCRCA